MIEVQNLVKRYGDHVAVQGLSFEVRQGEVLGFLGPNGAGKTTTMRIITGFLPATAGRVLVGGHDVATEAMAVKRTIGYLPEQPPLYLDMTVESFLNFVGKIKEVGKAERSDRVAWATQKCGLSDVRRRVIGNLSKGYRQRVGLAQAILHKPQVLILDEPTIGLDPRQIREIRDLIKELAGEHTVVLSTHILHEVTMTCKSVVIINRGHLAVKGPLEEVTAGRSLEEVFIGAIAQDEKE